ncbi:M3 family oligoendopeptidase [Deinococcus maricopensis]|uniref:Putative transcriptional regulator, TetR family n=1 Tax=Deinococcus maricopensis (strain DSM 21211 / LMG 22137 / NRRL B-23946 / LB-34) TaxID=709986 RepID=E8U7X9_DEIML|nr:M3 family oligoendopeptidase [Deinococcus maricopensis]ADV67168.1 putative transcriptional regulator, TetR family [Deinococcus maricopensis DSM 21211]
MTSTPAAMPHWDTQTLYPDLHSPALQADIDTFIADLTRLTALFDELGIHAGSARTDAGATAARALDGLNAVHTRLTPLSAYVQAFVTTDASNARAQALASELSRHALPLQTLTTRFQAWVGEQDLQALTDHNDTTRAHAHALHLAAYAAQHQMPAGEEDLAAQLSLSGRSAWSKLHGNVSSHLSVPFRDQQLPMTAIRNLAGDADPTVREEAYRAELTAWAAQDVTFAACMNGVKGEVGTLNRRRGYTDDLEPTLVANGIDRDTLNAMTGAVRASLPDFHRYFHAKARLLGHADGLLPWWDLFAPLGESRTQWTYDAAKDFVETQFRAYSPKLGDFAARAFREDWLDVPPRAGKRGGAFCMGWRPDLGESRILLNHAENLDSVSTLAHELGHAYHNLCKANRTPIQRQTPMTLAETASIFCETLTVGAALQHAQGSERLYILETQLLGHAQVVVDIHSRFLFEQAVFERRAERDLSPQELNDLMLQAQRGAYGDSLRPDALHPYMWAVKPHYYGRSFYNYPYTFGLLFGLGLYARYQQQPDGFHDQYDDLLASTGLADAATLAARFGIDTRDEAFWTSSLDVIRKDIEEYEKIAQA